MEVRDASLHRRPVVGAESVDLSPNGAACVALCFKQTAGRSLAFCPCTERRTNKQELGKFAKVLQEDEGLE